MKILLQSFCIQISHRSNCYFAVDCRWLFSLGLLRPYLSVLEFFRVLWFWRLISCISPRKFLAIISLNFCLFPYFILCVLNSYLEKCWTLMSLNSFYFPFGNFFCSSSFLSILVMQMSSLARWTEDLPCFPENKTQFYINFCSKRLMFRGCHPEKSCEGWFSI